jgi:hypothetical protein
MRRYTTLHTPGARTFESTLTPAQVANVKRAIYALSVKHGNMERASVALGFSTQQAGQIRGGQKCITEEFVDAIARHLQTTREAVLDGGAA